MITPERIQDAETRFIRAMAQLKQPTPGSVREEKIHDASEAFATVLTAWQLADQALGQAVELVKVLELTLESRNDV